MRADQERVRTLLKESISILCKNGLTYNQEITVEGLLGVTVDKREIFLVNVNELLKSDECELSSSQPSLDPHDPDASPLKRPASTSAAPHSCKKRRLVSKKSPHLAGDSSETAQVPTTSGMSVTAGDASVKPEDEEDNRDHSGHDMDDSLEISGEGQDSSMSKNTDQSRSDDGGNGHDVIRAQLREPALSNMMTGQSMESATAAAALVNQGHPVLSPGEEEQQHPPKRNISENSLREQLKRVLARCYDDEASEETPGGHEQHVAANEEVAKETAGQLGREGLAAALRTRRTHYDIDVIREVIEFAETHGNRPASRKFGLNESTIRGWRNRANWYAASGGSGFPDDETKGGDPPDGGEVKPKKRRSRGKKKKEEETVQIHIQPTGPETTPQDQSLGTFQGGPMYVLPGGVLQIPDAPAHAQQAVNLLSHVDTSAAGGIDPMTLLGEQQQHQDIVNTEIKGEPNSMRGQPHH